jgi:hypothetical protein
MLKLWSNVVVGVKFWIYYGHNLNLGMYVQMKFRWNVL